MRKAAHDQRCKEYMRRPLEEPCMRGEPLEMRVFPNTVQNRMCFSEYRSEYRSKGMGFTEYRGNRLGERKYSTSTIVCNGIRKNTQDLHGIQDGIRENAYPFATVFAKTHWIYTVFPNTVQNRMCFSEYRSEYRSKGMGFTEYRGNRLGERKYSTSTIVCNGIRKNTQDLHGIQDGIRENAYPFAAVFAKHIGCTQHLSVSSQRLDESQRGRKNEKGSA